MAKGALIFLIILISIGCKKDKGTKCYKCTFGIIQVNGSGPSYSSPDEIHCEPGAGNYKKYITIPGTVINNWQLPTDCRELN